MVNNQSIMDDIKGIKHICDNLYKVSIDLIKTESLKITEDQDRLRYINPRGITMPEAEIAGFSDEKMQILQNSIQDHGMINPIVCRIKSDKMVYLVEGHRRFKAVQSLIKNNLPCFDVSSNKNIPAVDLYSEVFVRLYDESFTDEECFKLAFGEDRTKIHFGSGAEIRFVDHCEQLGTDDALVLEMLGNTPEWLRETKSILRQLQQNDDILQAIFNDKITRSAAKSLAAISDVAERREIFEKAIEEAELDCTSKIDKIKKSIATVDKSIDIARSRKIVSEHIGNVEESEKYDSEIEELTSRKADLEDKIESTVAVVNPEALRKGAAKRVKTSSKTRAVVPPAERISTKWRKFFEELNKRGSIGDQEINRDLIDFVGELFNFCTHKDNDPEEFILRWNERFE